jgi:predicted Rossmann fold flavoprotein
LKDVAIIGAGASGLLCSIVCAKNGLSVDIFEKNQKPAKKILASGNGRCNIHNKNTTKDYYFSQNIDQIEYALKTFNFNEFEKFVNSFGLVLNSKDDGRCYPLSNEAKSVATLFIEYAKSLNVNFILNKEIKNIKELFKNYKYVVVATGSNAASHLGGCEDGYNFAKEFNHTVIPPYPALVQLELDYEFLAILSGVKYEADVTLLVNNQKELSVYGDILFTNYGISGFAILDISTNASMALQNFSYVAILVNLLPSYSQKRLLAYILDLKDLPIYNTLIGLLPTKIVNALLKELKIQPQTKVDAKLAKKIANKILNWKFNVKDTHGFRYAEASGGGVSLTEIDNKTFESKKHKNLFFCGEVLDVVGMRGGYNFAFAWASGYLSAKAIINKHLL